MATYERFEDLPVWQEAARLYEAVDIFIASRPMGVSGSFADQLERAALSVSNNIAEGFERGTTNELLAFIYIARGSAGEVRSMLCLLERKAEKAILKSQISNFKSEIPNLKSEISNLKSSAQSCSRQLRGWADQLQNSPITGQRHLNDAARARTKRSKDGEEINKLLNDSLPDGHPLKR